MTIRKELLDELLKGYQKPEDLLGESGILKQLTKALLDRCLQGEMTHHLGYAKNDPEGRHSGNSRNGSYDKTVIGEYGEMAVTVPRDRKGSFEPLIVPRGTSRFTGFDDKILSLYARGMTTRDIQGHLQEMYGVEVSPALISTVTEIIAELVLAILASIVVFYFSRKREYRADSGGAAAMVGKRPMIDAIEALKASIRRHHLPDKMAAFGISGAKRCGLTALCLS